jgi:tetratricopeptide (TPR) repeat protein
MKSRSAILGLLLALAIWGVVESGRRLEARVAASWSDDEAMWLPPAATLARWSFGFEGLLADLYWLRTVQYYGRRVFRPGARLEHLDALLDLVTTLDPHFLAAYRFGAIFLALPPPQGAGRPDRALALLDRGIAANPGQWRLLLDKGFVLLWDVRDYAKAAEVFLRVSRHPRAPAWTRDLAAAAFARAGRREIARRIWRDRLEHGESVHVRENARYQLLCLRAEEELERLQEIVRAFRRERGRWPSSWQEMILAGKLKHPPSDPLGYPYELDPTTGVVRLSARSPLILPRL